MSTEVAVRPAESSLPEAVSRRNIDEAQWRTLMNSLFPGARSESVLMVVDYCRARRLDPMKKPCHIVPMNVKDAKTGEWGWRDVVMPGIYEYRTTAMRTGLYLGHSKPVFGEMAEIFGVTAPEWCEMTMFRRASNGDRIEFPVRVYFREACATTQKKDDKGKRTGAPVANDRWAKAPIQMLLKTTEAAGLREAFPDEFGGEPTAEEMEGQFNQVTAEPKPAIQQPQRKSESAAVETATKEQPKDETVVEAEVTEKPAGITIVNGEKKNAANGRVYWVIKTSDDAIYYTADVEIAASCERLQQAKRPVEITAKLVSGQKHIEAVEPVGDAQ